MASCWIHLLTDLHGGLQNLQGARLQACGVAEQMSCGVCTGRDWFSAEFCEAFHHGRSVSCHFVEDNLNTGFLFPLPNDLNEPAIHLCRNAEAGVVIKTT